MVSTSGNSAADPGYETLPALRDSTSLSNSLNVVHLSVRKTNSDPPTMAPQLRPRNASAASVVVIEPAASDLTRAHGSSHRSSRTQLGSFPVKMTQGDPPPVDRDTKSLEPTSKMAVNTNNNLETKTSTPINEAEDVQAHIYG